MKPSQNPEGQCTLQAEPRCNWTGAWTLSPGSILTEGYHIWQSFLISDVFLKNGLLPPLSQGARVFCWVESRGLDRSKIC